MRADARRNYEALLAAARDLFQEQGPDAPLDEVAKRAGVGAGTLYRHFPTRNDLVAAVYVADIDALCDAAEKLAAEDPDAALGGYMDLHVGFTLRNAGIKKAIKEMLADGDTRPGLTLCKTRMTEIAGETLAHAQDAGAAREDVDTVTFLRMLHGIALACEENPEMAPAMLEVMKAGLLRGA
ncbi:TetR/AcrR family transcriptional regulator [Actinospica sp. MGRD01-02]|uniref:TetR/AcrR family transcriptional regulator n=1 Tax=Actinospica acidithermotolerans TaxID=2828514 RepID=A0A941IMH0_9ACTN|nr:TetR/AcrR family transcriptional regulator [Actinospica acidithermotolerans]MBR7829993.1 TetR/AcrR family transcriptional regulator [Actinospica acidithermotolerans]